MHRRAFLSGAFGAAALAPVAAAASYTPATLRGTVDANEHGLVAGSGDDQGPLLQKLLVDAAKQDRPLFVPPGRYLVSNVTLPARTRLIGIAKQRGIAELIGEVLRENGPMLQMCHELGFEIARDPSDPSVMQVRKRLASP